MNDKTYEAPKVEKVVTPAEFEREVLYAGTGPSGEEEVIRPPANGRVRRF